MVFNRWEISDNSWLFKSLVGQYSPDNLHLGNSESNIIKQAVEYYKQDATLIAIEQKKRDSLEKNFWDLRVDCYISQLET